MELSLLLSELRGLIDIAFGVTLTDRQFAIIMVVITAISLGVINSTWKLLLTIFHFFDKRISRFRQDQETKDFIRVRNRFVNHIMIELERLNQEADWNDFFYTKLQAQVEVEPDIDSTKFSVSYILAWAYSIPSLLRLLFGFTPSGELVDNLTEAIIHSKSRSFLVIGEPGSGKTVSLKHLALKLAKDCSISTKPNTSVPLYFNLKVLDIPHEEINADSIRKWMLEQLSLGQDRLISQFLDKYFDYMLRNGYFFIMFDSFDEIPAVMDAGEDTEIVKDYAIALSRFLHAPHACRGVVSSRPYRAPKTFVGQKITIKSLTNQRIEKAIKNYLIHQSNLANVIWIKMIRERDDLLRIASNPFLLGLLARYISETKELPDRKYDLYEHFLQIRVNTDAHRIKQIGLTPEKTLELASALAYEMTRTPEIGLESNTVDIINVLRKQNLNKKTVEKLLDALAFSKISRLSQSRAGLLSTFSFVHRRFQEYFCARYLQHHSNEAPIEYLMLDNRWREILILLCEVMPIKYLPPMYKVANTTLKKGVGTPSNSKLHREAIETLRFLRDGFRSRLDDLPKKIRDEATRFINYQFEHGDLLDKKRSIESLIVVDKESAPRLIEVALESDSSWIKETVLYSCRNIASPTVEIQQKIRSYLHGKYSNLDLFSEFRFLSILLSFPQTFIPLRSYLYLLGTASLIETGALIGLIAFLGLSNMDIGLGLVMVLLIFFTISFLLVNWMQSSNFIYLLTKKNSASKKSPSSSTSPSFISKLYDSRIFKLLEFTTMLMDYPDNMAKKISNICWSKE